MYVQFYLRQLPECKDNLKTHVLRNMHRNEDIWSFSCSCKEFPSCTLCFNDGCGLMKHIDSVVQHHVSDGPTEAAEKDVWQDTSAGHRHHDRECLRICWPFYFMYSIQWYDNIALLNCFSDLTKLLFVCSTRHVSFWLCVLPSGWVNQERKRLYCLNYKIWRGSDKFLFFSNSGRISAWLCCFASCKSCLLPGKLLVSPLIFNINREKYINFCLMYFAGTVSHISLLSGLPFHFWNSILIVLKKNMWMCDGCDFLLQGGNMQVAGYRLEVKPWWRLKVQAGWRLIAHIFLCCCHCSCFKWNGAGLFAKLTWTDPESLWLHLLHIYLCTQHCFFGRQTDFFKCFCVWFLLH